VTKIQYKAFEFKIEDADDSPSAGVIRGLASTFGNIDLGDDIVDEGAFKKTIQESKGKVPILADHDPSKQIGWNLRAEESDKGLMVEGELNLKTQLGKERYELAKQALKIGAKMGLSIGYGIIKAMPDKDRPSVRRLKELKLYEYSMVTFPMNTSAMVTAAKAWADQTTKDEFMRVVLQKSKELGISPSDVVAALEKQAAADTVTEPKSLLHSLGRLEQTILNLTKGA
jgi:HK97 family phage prohead protease